VQTGIRLALGRRESWSRHANYLEQAKQDLLFGHAELNFGPGRWSSVLTSCQDVADHRMNDETWAFVEKTLQRYVGTHNFHNFTVGHQPQEPTCQRYMLEFHVSKPFMLRGVEFVAMRVLGQSFMLHQIRKMVCLVVMLAQRGIQDAAYLDIVFAEAFSNHKFNIPPCPPDGLFLDRLFFDAYNRNVEMVGKGMRSELKLHTPEIEKELDSFKQMFIRDHIAQTVILQRPFQNWVNGLKYFGYDMNMPGDRELVRRNGGTVGGGGGGGGGGFGGGGFGGGGSRVGMKRGRNHGRGGRGGHQRHFKKVTNGSDRAIKQLKIG